MGVLNFCDPCGALPVRQVKGQLDKLFVDKTLPKQDRCVICLRFFAPKLKDRKTKLKGNQTRQKDAVKKDAVKMNFKREKIDSNDGDDGYVIPFKKNKKSRTRLETGTIKPFHFRDIGSDDENEGIDIPFTAVNVSEDSDSSCSTSGKKPVLTAVKSNKSKRSICKKKKNKGKEEKKMGSKKKKKKGPEIITDEEFVNRRSLDQKVLDMVDKGTNEGLKTKALKCKECSVSFCHIQKFITHVNTHLDDKLDVPFPYICPICSRNERTYMDLDRHMIMHKKERPFSCDWPGCTWKFTCQRYLTKHIMRHQGHKSYCGRRPSTKVRKFKCSQCEYTACSKQILEFHENTHTNARPYKCDHCNRSFNCPRNKQIHEMNMHSNSKDNHFMCELCGYSSFFKADLKKHQRIHSGEKPFQCEHCEYRSSRADNLRKHLRVHTGEKKHKCSHCDLVFHSQQSCKKHEAAVHISKKEEFAFPISLQVSDGKDVQFKESANCTPGVPSNEIANPANMNLQGSQNQHVSIIHDVPEKESDHSTSSLKMTSRPCHPQNLPMINNPAMAGARDKIYDLSRSEVHESQLRTHQGPVESEEQEAPLRLHQEPAQTEEHRSQLSRHKGPLQNEGHVTPLRPLNISEEQRPILRPHQEPQPSEGHVTPLRPVIQSEGQRRLLSPHQEPLQSEGHGHAAPLRPQGAIQNEAHGAPLRPQGAIQRDGHGPQLRPNQGPLHSEGPGAPVRPLQWLQPNDRSQSEWIRAVNLLQHLNQM